MIEERIGVHKLTLIGVPEVGVSRAGPVARL